MGSPGAAAPSVGSCVTLALLLCAPGVAQDDAGALAGELERIAELADRGDAQEGLAELARLLEANRGADVARHRRATIVELDRRLRFALEFRAPEPADVVSGELSSYDPKLGRIKLRYGPDQLGDFAPLPGRLQARWRSETKLHSALFRGKHSIRIEGSRYPRSGIRVVVCLNDGSFYDVHVGVPPASGSSRSYLATRIVRVDAVTSRQTLRETLFENHWGADDRKKKIRFPVAQGEPYAIEVSVQDRRIVVSNRGRRVAVAKKSRNDRGRFGFDAPGFEELTAEGRVETAWIENRIDAETQAAVARFAASYDPEQHLPAWLFADAAPPPPPTGGGGCSPTPLRRGPRRGPPTRRCRRRSGPSTGSTSTRCWGTSSRATTCARWRRSAACRTAACRRSCRRS